VFKRDVSSDESPIRLRQHGFFFFIKNLHMVQIFYEKDLISSALPEVEIPSGSVTA